MSERETPWRQRSIVIALALAALAGFFLIGRAITDDDGDEPPAPRISVPNLNLPAADELALNGSIPDLAGPQRRQRQGGGANEGRPDETPQPAPEPTTEPEEVPAETEPVSTPAPTPEPAPTPPPEPAPTPPAPTPEPEPQPDKPNNSSESTSFDDSG